MKRRTAVTMLAALALAALSGPSVRAQTYTFTDLGVLNAASPYASALGINNAGQIVGQSRVNANTTRVFRITPTTDGSGHQSWYVDANSDGVNDLAQILPLPTGFAYSYAYSGDINGSGQATCVALAAYATAPQDAVVWSASAVPALLTNTNVTSSGFGLNDGGDVVGNYWDYKKHKPTMPYLWQFTNGSYTAVQLAGTSGWASSVNNLRQVTGTLDAGGAFLWLPSPTYGLPAGMNLLSGISIGGGKSINNTGIIAGTGASPNNPNHILLRVPPGGGAAYGLNDGLNDIDDGVWVSSYINGLNNPLAGQPLQAVGGAFDAPNNTDTHRYAVVWDSGSRSLRNLNSFTTNLPSGYVLRSANGINDLGQIVGYATFNGVQRAFVLTPQ